MISTINNFSFARTRVLENKRGMRGIQLLYLTFNNNRGCCDDWSYGVNISKRLWHFNIREVAVRDDVQAGDVTVTHLPGKVNIADLFTKEIRVSFRLIGPL